MKAKDNKKLAKLYHFDLYGKRNFKQEFLKENTVSSIKWNELKPSEPQYYFVPKDFELMAEYEQGFKVNELFPLNGVGLTTAHDDFVIAEKSDDLEKRFMNFKNSERNADTLHEKFNVNKKTGWNILSGYDNLQKESDLKKYIQPISYRPFDNRFVFYEDKLVWRTVRKVMQHFLHGENVGLAGIRINKENEEAGYSSVFISKNISEARLADRFITNIFPIYLYQTKLGSSELERVPNLNTEMVNKIAKDLKLTFINNTPPLERGLGGVNFKTKITHLNPPSREEFGPLDILDYIYAVLHSPTYRERYKEFLKIDFPRVPFTNNQKIFWEMVKLGGEIRKFHLMEHSESSNLITQFPVSGENEVVKIEFHLTPCLSAGRQPLSSKDKENVGQVWINETQYFENVPEVAWNFYIGGYQPAQKWLKDRKGKKLSFEDVLHYQKIIVALINTDRLMNEVDKVYAQMQK